MSGDPRHFPRSEILGPLGGALKPKLPVVHWVFPISHTVAEMPETRDSSPSGV